MVHKYNFEKVEKYLLKQTPIHLREFDKKLPNKSLCDNIVHIIKGAEKHYTVNKHDKIECSPSGLRSIGDIYLLCRNYYKDLTFKELFYTLVYLIREGEIKSWVCGAIDKRVYFTYTSSVNFLNSLSDEYGFDFTIFNLRVHNSAYGSGKTATIINI